MTSTYNYIIEVGNYVIYIELSHYIVLLQLLEVYQQSINEFMEVLVTRAREHEAKTEAYEYAKEMAILAKLREAEELVV